MPDFSQEVLSINLGAGIIVISKRVGLLIFGALFLVFLYFAWGESSADKISRQRLSKMLDADWETFIDDCGSDVILRNPVKAKVRFERKYENNVITWNGFLVE